ncbi:major capsid family protein [Fulvimarina sp. 2208YS6-2-32]|uniref:Major capsid family protein n=1 Tax=Fulvimarina uroteuthidis TaxID=3098149 RepID=A0ABU5I0D1_9HYPH|nr:major capsid family protein [Fulvimarina sp. 2208YS6-2-32]MDY8108264.1 major capsid family protein [Fulvimarina sp. 2208YS6-2-32]
MQTLMTNDAMQSNLGFVTSQTAYVETQVYQTRYAAIRYTGLIPVDYSAPEWIKTVDYYSMDVAGKAEWLADRANDIPVVGMQHDKQSTQVYMAGIGYDYGLEEINQARMLGIPLESTKADTARLAYERMVDRIAFSGDAAKGFNGLFDYPGITIDGDLTGSWETATEDQILADVNELLEGVAADTNEVAMADTLLLPPSKTRYIGSRRLGDGNGSLTIRAYLEQNNSYTAETGQPLTIRSLRGLETAGAGGTTRMIAYRNAPEVMKMHIPMRHRFLPVQIVGLTYKIPGIFRLGGLDIRLTKEVRYGDGI